MKNSLFLKLLVSGVLVLLLLVPLALVRGVIEEREKRSAGAVAEVTSTWGGAQTVVGPVLSVPYRTFRVDEKGRRHTCTNRALFLPDRLEVTGELSPEIRQRGIFQVVLYRGDLVLSGTMPHPDLSPLVPADAEVLWSEATLAVGLSDTRGVKEKLSVAWDGKELPMEPGTAGSPLSDTGVHLPLHSLSTGPAADHPFRLRLRLQGSGSLSVAPLGAETVALLRSPWKDPGFVGAFLPDRRSIGAGGFTAEWRVSSFGRSYPQGWTTESVNADARSAAIGGSSFGVRLVLPADHYQRALRSVKYAVLFVVLTFVAFFLFELLASLRLHPLHYLLVGAALALFYLLLVSLAEQLGFPLAYLAASAAIVGLVGLYAAAILGRRLRGLAIGGLLAALYGSLYVVVNAEDYALLLGSVALFVVLALVMWLTRKVDWWALSTPAPARVPPPPPVWARPSPPPA